MSNTFSPRTDGTVGKVAVRSQAHAAHLTIPLMLDAGSDIQDNNPTGPEHTEGGDSLAQAPARHIHPKPNPGVSQHPNEVNESKQTALSRNTGKRK